METTGAIGGFKLTPDRHQQITN